MARVIEIRHPAQTAARGAIHPPRIPAVDIARGAALVAMGLYHLVWDLDFLGLIQPGVATSPPMRLASHAIASAFLLIAGASVALTHRGRFNGKAFRTQFIKVALAAAAVTAATAFAMPQAPVTFGILHAIAFGLLICAPLAKAPFLVTAATGAAMVAAALFVSDARLDHPALSWLGLGTGAPNSVDWRPVFPWTGVMLLGLAAARSPFGQAALVRIGQTPAPASTVSRGLEWAGRRSLWIYLAHQPVLFGALWIVAQLAGASPEKAMARPFLDSCASACRAQGAAPETCARSCGCVVRELGEKGALADALRGLDASRGAVEAASQLCAAQAR